ncbi:Calcium-binding protein CML19 [Hondaea fermentalgiana]|uniref:Calcium-binding protein CML19 n=1 Tax=Hondaea fermentalgiana TaxID=2315210 RepID=A0A2R5GRL2_9STRA|nr:Calcium-binding protein CML19 [Hondaea fermentalgiana]|eukprot:GBG33526.1 Calcium-binding protein CML19 [Hondaea fermentalgiana]
MGAGSSILGQSGQEGLRCASPSPTDVMRVKLLAELRHEKSLDPNAKDVEDHHAEVIRLRSWLRDVDGILTRMVGEAADQAAGIFEDKGSNLPESRSELEDGTVIFMREDGYRRQEDTDGVIIHSWPDGRKKQVHPTGREQETLPDNTRITRTEDGKIITKRPDGSKYQVNPDGTTISVTKDGIVEQYNPSDIDGTTTQINESDGSKICVFPDGTKIDTDAAGVRIVKYPGKDQYRIQRNPNGTTIETWGSTGRKVQTRADKIQTSPSGEVIEQMPDGTCRKVAGSYIAVQCHMCQTISSVQRASYLVSCRMCRNILLTHKSHVEEGRKTLSKSEEELDGEILEIFQHYDKNHSSSIDRSELGALLSDLQIPHDNFEQLFVEKDANKSEALEWEEFESFFKAVLLDVAASGQASSVQITNDILREQRSAIEAETKSAEARQRELEAKARLGDTAASTEMEEQQTLLRKLKAEYEQKTAQLQHAKEAKRKMQREALKRKKMERDAMRSPK